MTGPSFVNSTDIIVRKSRFGREDDKAAQRGAVVCVELLGLVRRRGPHKAGPALSPGVAVEGEL